MSDTLNAAPAGVSEHVAASTVTGPLTMDGALSMLREAREADDTAAAASEPAEQETGDATTDDASETEEVEAATEHEEAPTGDDAEETPAEDAETGDDQEPTEEKFVHGNAKTRLSDGKVVAVGELKKAFGELQEIRARLPELTAAQERVQQYQQREAQIKDQEQFFQQTFPVLAALSQDGIPPEPDPSMMDQNSPNFDPIKFGIEDFNRRKAIEDRQKRIAGIEQQLKQQQQQAEQARAAEFAKVVEEHRKALFTKIPEMNDPVKRDAIMKNFVDIAKSFEFTDQEIQSVYDSRLVTMVHTLSQKAAAYDKLMAQKPVVQAKAKTATTTAVAQPGRRQTQAEVSERQMNERFREFMSGGRSIEDAVRFLHSVPIGNR